MVSNSNLNNLVSKKNLVRGVSLVVILLIITTCKKEDEFELFKREPAPTITVTQVENGIKISWDEVRGADSYELLKSKYEFNTFSLIYHYYPNETFYIDKNLLDGDNYYGLTATKLKKGKYYYHKSSNVEYFYYTAPSYDTGAD